MLYPSDDVTGQYSLFPFTYTDFVPIEVWSRVVEVKGRREEDSVEV